MVAYPKPGQKDECEIFDERNSNFPFLLVTGECATLLVNMEKHRADVLMFECPKTYLA